MVNRRQANERMVALVAARLDYMRGQVVFLGGAILSLLLTDPAAPEVRPTMDVDVIVQVGTRVGYDRIGEDLQALGFSRDTEEGAPACRWRIEGIRLDVMPTEAEIIGFSNRWYPVAMGTATPVLLSDGTEIRLISPACFVATKLDAFRSRGNGDFAGSHDLEDVVAIMDGRPEIIDEIGTAPPDMRSFIAEEFRKLLGERRFREALSGHLPPDTASQGRASLVLGRMERLSAV